MTCDNTCLKNTDTFNLVNSRMATPEESEVPAVSAIILEKLLQFKQTCKGQLPTTREFLPYLYN